MQTDVFWADCHWISVNSFFSKHNNIDGDDGLVMSSPQDII